MPVPRAPCPTPQRGPVPYIHIRELLMCPPTRLSCVPPAVNGFTILCAWSHDWGSFLTPAFSTHLHISGPVKAVSCRYLECVHFSSSPSDTQQLFFGVLEEAPCWFPSHWLPAVHLALCSSGDLSKPFIKFLVSPLPLTPYGLLDKACTT